MVGQACALKELVSGGGCMKKANGSGQCGKSLRAEEVREKCFQPQGLRKKDTFCQGLHRADKGVKSTSEVPSRVEIFLLTVPQISMRLTGKSVCEMHEEWPPGAKGLHLRS